MDLIADSSSTRLNEKSHLIIERFRLAQNIPSNFTPVTFLADYTSQQYIYMDEVCIHSIGFPAKFYYEKGLKGYWKQFYPSDYAIINNIVFPANFRFLEKVPSERYSDYVFSHNYRIQNPKGECVMMLQRYSYLPGNTPGKPIGIIGVGFDITHFKNDLNIIHTIEKSIPHGNEIINDVLYKETYPVYNSAGTQRISKKELEILNYMADGLSSKQIASKLSISINTVNNHRKNLLQKTDCKNSAELLSLAAKHGLL